MARLITSAPSEASQRQPGQRQRGLREGLGFALGRNLIAIPDESIFGRKRPLAKSTLERILMGLKKFGSPALEPWLVVLRNHMHGKSIRGPLPTVTASGNHVGLAEPFFTVSHGLDGHKNGRTRSVHDPMPTITGANDHGVVEPYLIHVNHTRDKFRGQPVSEPLRTVTAKRGIALCDPYLVHINQKGSLGLDSLDDPMRTITCDSADFGLVEPVMEPAGQPFLVRVLRRTQGANPADPFDRRPTPRRDLSRRRRPGTARLGRRRTLPDQVQPYRGRALDRRATRHHRRTDSPGGIPWLPRVPGFGAS